MATPRNDIFSWNLKTLYASTLIDVTLAGVQLFMWIYMASRLRTIHKASISARLLYLHISFILLVLTSASAIVHALGIYRILLEVVPGNQPENVKLGWAVVDRVNKELLVYGEAVWSLSVFIIDSVLVYRCYIVWFDRKWVPLLPVGLQVANVGIGIKSIVTLLSGRPNDRDRRLDIANIMISVVLHLMITFLICGKLLYTHRKLTRALSYPSVRTADSANPFSRTISILVESAAPLAMFGLGTAVTVALPPSPQAAKVGMVVQIPYKIFMTLSLQLIIFRVAMGWSWADKDESEALISQEIHFADCEAGDRDSYRS